ncbi:carbohydrate ABC transporter permease [Paenibacillus koleovorans]|uniref:carbohydrate ABC transporter permease n=1 Tax=Paenibacillus koleovorans TaxID=121608 RepID=UPI000FD8B353|nr:carbohydrate ABC transporter permease [Paenibacillus koleovorans]
MYWRASPGRKVFIAFNTVFLIVAAALCLMPVIHVLSQSFSGSGAIQRGEVLFWPVEFTLSNYQHIMKDQSILRAFGISAFLATFGTFVNLLLTASLAYPLSRPEYSGRKVILFLIMFTMIFSPSLIPAYLLVQKLGLLNSLAALIIPSAISAFNFFIMRSFFMNIPSELIDSGRIDGCSELRILSSIVLPLSKPALATLSIFYAVSHWNSYLNALMYIENRKLYPLQIKLRQLLIEDKSTFDVSTELSMYMSPEGVKMAAIMVASLPIIAVYPFVQKYFVKGALLGGIKG